MLMVHYDLRSRLFRVSLTLADSAICTLIMQLYYVIWSHCSIVHTWHYFFPICSQLASSLRYGRKN